MSCLDHITRCSKNDNVITKFITVKNLFLTETFKLLRHRCKLSFLTLSHPLPPPSPPKKNKQTNKQTSKSRTRELARRLLFSLDPFHDTSRALIYPSLLSPLKPINSDWMRVCTFSAQPCPVFSYFKQCVFVPLR